MKLKTETKRSAVTGALLTRRYCDDCGWQRDGAWHEFDWQLPTECSQCNDDGVERKPVDLNIDFARRA